MRWKKKYRIKKIEENEKVSTQNNKKKDWHKQKTKVSTQFWDEKKIPNKEYRRKQKGEHAKLVRMQKQKIFKEIYGDILREKKINKRLSWAHNLEMKINYRIW